MIFLVATILLVGIPALFLLGTLCYAHSETIQKLNRELELERSNHHFYKDEYYQLCAMKGKTPKEIILRSETE